MRNLLNHWTTKSALFLGIALASTGIASGQAAIVASRGATLAPFATTTILRPDWGSTNNIGYTAGVDYTRYLRTIVQPSLEIRFANATGTHVNEHSFTGGFKLETVPVHGLRPYGTFLAGTGMITFNQPQPGYTQDSSFVWSLGGGIETYVRPGLKLRADFTQQHWNLPPPLTPMTFSLGVAYTLPFGGGGWEH